MAFHDELTKLPNRKMLLDRLAVAIDLARRRESGVALLFIDLDEFKPLNDLLWSRVRRPGPLGGGAATCARTARASDTVARIGGDEFTVLMPDVTSRDQAETVARKLVAAFREPFDVRGQLGEHHREHRRGGQYRPRRRSARPCRIRRQGDVRDEARRAQRLSRRRRRPPARGWSAVCGARSALGYTSSRAGVVQW